MPLREGKSRKTISSNIETEMKSYKRKGSIGTSHPANKKKAQKQAVAIALSKARRSGAKIPKKGHKKMSNIYLEKIASMVENVEEQENKYIAKIAASVGVRPRSDIGRDQHINSVVLSKKEHKDYDSTKSKEINKKFLKYTGIGSVAGAGAGAYMTRKVGGGIAGGIIGAGLGVGTAVERAHNLALKKYQKDN